MNVADGGIPLMALKDREKCAELENPATKAASVTE